MFTKKTIKDINLRNKTVLLRVDYNVPIKDGRIEDDYRIVQSIPTIRYLLEHDCKIVICSHLGRPEGIDPKYSLQPVALRLAKLLDMGVAFSPSAIGEGPKKQLEMLKNGQILVLENLRFYEGEEKDDAGFAKELASLADIFVQDAFGVVHRFHASTVAITKYLPSVSGLLLEKEVDTITNVVNNPVRPLMVIIGGAKIADKIDILEKFIHSADFVAIGGAMANTFLKAAGHHIGSSVYDVNEISIANRLMHLANAQAKERSFVFRLPFDGVVAKDVSSKSPVRIVDWSSYVISELESYPKKPRREDSIVKADEKILDIGPFTGAFIAGSINSMKTVIWNGTMGVTETPSLLGSIGPYAHGSELILQAIGGDFGNKPYSVVGGGDTVGFVQSTHLDGSVNHLSTGGGASLELLGGHKLPGVEALIDR